MKSFLELLRKRRSCRTFSAADLTSDEVTCLLEAALLAPTGRNARACHFYVVDNKDKLLKLSDAKENGSKFLADTALAIIVTCNENDASCWVEDCSIAAITMQYQAAEIGIGSCWCQINGHYLSDCTSSEDVVRGIADIPEDDRILCVVGFGKQKFDNMLPKTDRELLWENVKIVE